MTAAESVIAKLVAMLSAKPITDVPITADIRAKGAVLLGERVSSAMCDAES